MVGFVDVTVEVLDGDYNRIKVRPWHSQEDGQWLDRANIIGVHLCDPFPGVATISIDHEVALDASLIAEI